MILERLCDLFILHKGLDPNDEDSTVEEQVDKLLYIFSKNAGDANERVQLITTVEALMELSKSFMGKSLDSTIMNDKTWTFYECEPGIWIVLSMRNDHVVAPECGENLELMSSYGCRLFLIRLYSLLRCMVGSLQAYLTGPDGSGWNCIQRMITARKNVRKTQMKLGNAQNDIEKLHDDQRQGIEREGMSELLRQSEELINGLSEKLSVEKENLAVELASSSYRLPFLKDKISSFLVWYLSIEDFNNVSCLTSTFDVMNGKLRDRAAAGTIHRIMRRVHQTLPQLQFHCVMSFDNRLLWSDVDVATTTSIVDFLARWDSSFLVSQPNVQLRKAMRDFSKSIYQETRCDYPSLDAAQKAKLVESVRELEERKRQRMGVMTQRGHYISFDKYSVRLPSIQRISELRSRFEYSVPENERATSNGSSNTAMPYVWPSMTTKETIANTTSSSARKRLAQGLSFFDSLDMGDGNALVCNPIFPVPHSQNQSTPQQQSLDEPLGRAMFLFFGRLVLTIIIPTEQLEALYSVEFQALIWSYTTSQLNVTPSSSMPPVSPDEEVQANSNAENNNNDGAGTEPESSAKDTPMENVNANVGAPNEANGTMEVTAAAESALLVASSNTVIPALQINSIRMARLVEKLEQIVRDASYPRMAHFHDYDQLATLQVDIAKLKVMYIAKKIRDSIIGDLSPLSDIAGAPSATNTINSATAASAIAMRKGSIGGRSAVSPIRSSSVSYSGSAAPPALLLRRDSTSAPSLPTSGSGTPANPGSVTPNGVMVDNVNGGSGNMTAAQAQWYVQLHQAQWLVQRSSPGTLRGMLHPKIAMISNQEREVRALCISPTYCAIKMFSLDVDGVVYGLSQADYGSISASYPGTPTPNSQNSQQMVQWDAALDRYFLSLSRYSEAALLLVHSVIHQFGFAVVRAVHDIWSHLVPLNADHSADSNNSERGCGVMSTRISTPQRGGIWVVGSRLLNNKPMLVVVTNCGTFDEVMEVFDLLGQEASG